MKSVLSSIKDWARFSLAAGWELWRHRATLVPFALLPFRFHDPYPFYRRLRDLAPLCRSHLCGGIVLSRAEHVEWALDNERLTADLRHSRVWRADGVDDPSTADVALAFDDGPDHARLRQITIDALQRLTTPAALARWSELTDEALSKLPRVGEADLVGQFVDPLARRLCAELLGVPSEHRRSFESLMRQGLIFAFHDGDRLTRYPAVFRSYRGESKRLRDHVRQGFRPIFERSTEPRPGVLSYLCDACAAAHITPGQGMQLCEQIMAAAYEAFSLQLGNLLLGLSERPATYRRLHGAPDLQRAAVKEFERYDSAVQVMVRFAAEDADLDGYRIAAGEQVVLLIGSANRDERRFASPDEVCLERSELNLAYGKGRHRCAGMPLGRLLQSIVLDHFTRRYPAFRPAGPPKRTRRLPMRGPTILPVSLG